ncbi:YaaL family protein [Peribacillus sp. NPDC096379]|uniref:YaaL family protein n=1 Tax=Peribacillus sp. NPDC096379 TaxID=3364393 RepID=UPI00078353BC
MFFRRKGKLRNENNQKLVQQLEEIKRSWLNQKSLLEKSLDPSEDAIIQTKISEIKYFYLFKEAKRRKVTASKRK